jgi:hypothetical protein
MRSYEKWTHIEDKKKTYSFWDRQIGRNKDEVEAKFAWYIPCDFADQIIVEIMRYNVFAYSLTPLDLFCFRI